MEITNAVLEERLKGIQDANSREHADILEQVKKTNGKVADIDKWRWMIVGALTFITICILPIIFTFANKYFNS